MTLHGAQGRAFAIRDDIMTWVSDDELFALVVTMRRHQREFSKFTRPEDRPPGLLKQCKDLELRVDKALAARRAEQASLFAPEALP